MKRLLLTTALCAGPAFAETVDVFVVQKDGSGVVQHESNVTVDAAAILIEGERPAGTTGVVLEDGKSVVWTTLTPEEINRRHGGTGAPYVTHGENEDPDEMEFDADEERDNQADVEEDPRAAQADDDDDMEFDEEEERRFQEGDSMNAAQIKPLAGNWIGDMTEQTFDGCPKALEAPLRAQASAMSMSAVQGTIDPTFTPQRMAPQFDWTKTGANSWVGTLDQMTQGSGVRVQWAIQIKTPSLIESRQQLNFGLDAMGSCEVYMVTYLLRA
ncbi:hypothetical protein [Falsihalocynthiibacter arcticus]|uniref:Uncharacterized protein n=1 Tax=Falsihalocynthiibacter arcticus TaxID=1579316 RepID=A0A126V0Y3_9RHOB|nr:hypothetical protein [Falsihalocynthiibacter arcticus]AML51950.1 hypothetical protein RC74_12335 [Falsihalocynthiibacter arcticus]